MRTASRAEAFLAFALCSLASTTSAQSSASDIHRATTSPSDARFEIIQSQLAAKWTFRLDRYTGHVRQLVKTQDGGSAWQAMSVEGLPELLRPNKPRFVIFTSGLAARHTFLMDTETGNTWVPVSTTFPIEGGDPVEIVEWWPLEQ